MVNLSEGDSSDPQRDAMFEWLPRPLIKHSKAIIPRSSVNGLTLSEPLCSDGLFYTWMEMTYIFMTENKCE